MLKLEEITVRFGDATILDGISMEVGKDDFVIISGQSGAGKSTLFEVICGYIKPSFGRVLVDGRDITHQSAYRRAPFIARLQQNTAAAVVASMTVAENLALATSKGRCCTLGKAMAHFPHEIVQEILEPMQLKTHLQTPVAYLSGGQRQIVALVMSILVKPSILLLDEPTAALDPKSATTLMAFAQDYIKKHELPTLLITHDREMGNVMGNQRFVLSDGKLIKQL